MSRRMVLILAVTCAVAVGNIYFPQAIGPLVAAGVHVSPDSAAAVVTATQVGYTAGMVLLVPLGDRLPHRSFLVVLLALTGLALLAAGCAPALPALMAASTLVGLTTAGAQIVGPLAAGLVAADCQGAVIGTLLSGSTDGMLLARTFSGTLGEWLGWRAPYFDDAAPSSAHESTPRRDRSRRSTGHVRGEPASPVAPSSGRPPARAAPCAMRAHANTALHPRPHPVAIRRPPPGAAPGLRLIPDSLTAHPVHQVKRGVWLTVKVGCR